MLQRDSFVKRFLVRPTLQHVPHTITPNAVSQAGVCVALAAAGFAAAGAWTPAVLLFMAHCWLDCLDGELARARDLQSKAGDFCDHAGDALSVTFLAYVVTASLGMPNIIPILIAVMYYDTIGKPELQATTLTHMGLFEDAHFAGGGVMLLYHWLGAPFLLTLLLWLLVLGAVGFCLYVLRETMVKDSLEILGLVITASFVVPLPAFAFISFMNSMQSLLRPHKLSSELVLINETNTSSVTLISLLGGLMVHLLGFPIMFHGLWFGASTYLAHRTFVLNYDAIKNPEAEEAVVLPVSKEEKNDYVSVKPQQAPKEDAKQEEEDGDSSISEPEIIPTKGYYTEGAELIDAVMQEVRNEIAIK